MEKKLDLFKPSPYFAWAVHMDGLRERHDESVVPRGRVRQGRRRRSRRPRRAGFRVTTNTTFFTDDTPETVREVLDFLNDELEVDQMMISPAYAYEKAPDQEHFLGVEQTRAAVPRGVRRRPPQALAAEPLAAVPRLPRGQGRLPVHRRGASPATRCFGWQRPCYLMADGYAQTYKELVETTDWEKYGRGSDPRCDNCMAHCGYEPTAVNETVRAPHKALLSVLRRLSGQRAASGR